VANAKPAAPAAPVANVKPVAPAKPVEAPRPVVAPKAQPASWNLGRIAKAAGATMGGFTAGGAATFVADLFFHFGNNGGTAWPGGIYLMGAGLAAAGALALYAKLSSK
jgi:hypothetical protein